MAQVSRVKCPKMFMTDLFLREKLPVGEGEERICPKVPAYVRRSQFRLPNRAQVGEKNFSTFTFNFVSRHL